MFHKRHFTDIWMSRQTYGRVSRMTTWQQCRLPIPFCNEIRRQPTTFVSCKLQNLFFKYSEQETCAVIMKSAASPQLLQQCIFYINFKNSYLTGCPTSYFIQKIAVHIKFMSLEPRETTWRESLRPPWNSEKYVVNTKELFHFIFRNYQVPVTPLANRAQRSGNSGARPYAGSLFGEQKGAGGQCKANMTP